MTRLKELVVPMAIVKRVGLVVLIAAVAMTVGVRIGQNDIASRWCPAFNPAYEDGYVDGDRIICRVYVNYPLVRQPPSDKT